MALTVFASYDVSHDQRRAKLAALLQSCGDRIQKSLFVCYLEPDQLDGLVEDVGRIIDVDTDSFLLIRQCRPCWETMGSLGQTTRPDPQLYAAVF